MANLSNLIKVTQAQYLTLLNGGTITKGGVTYSYDPYAFYVVEDDVSKKYLHNIYLKYSNTHIATFSFISSRSSSYGDGTTTNWSTLLSDLYNNGYVSATTTCPAHGQFYTFSSTSILMGVYRDSSTTMGFTGLTLASVSDSTMTINTNPVVATGTLSNAATIYDVVQEL